MTELELMTLLGAHDGVLDDLDKRIAAAEARIPDGQAAVEAAKQALQAARDARKQSQDTEKSLAREARLYEQRRDGATRALEGGHGDPDAAERQIRQCTDILDGLETQQLEQMDVSAAADEAVQAAEAALARAQEALAASEVQVPPILADLREQRATEQMHRDGVWAQLHAEIKLRYGLLRTKRKFAVAPLIDGYCNACRHKVPLAEGAEVRKGLLRSCFNCGRYLVLPV